MRVAELMTVGATSIAPDATIAEAVAVIADEHVSALPVVDHAGRFAGVLSTTDILQSAAEAADRTERERVFEETLVKDLMTARPATVPVTADIKEAAQQMLYLEIHRLFVVDDEKLVGVISQSDIVRGVALARI
jgi:CBS domain-containing protein